MKINLTVPDYIMIVAFMLMLANHGITQFLIAQHTTVAETLEDAKNVISVVEQNPLAAFVLQYKKLAFLYSRFFVPGLFIGGYVWFRRKYNHNQDIMFMMTTMVVSFLLINFFNDFGYLMGFWLR